MTSTFQLISFVFLLNPVQMLAPFPGIFAKFPSYWMMHGQSYGCHSFYSENWNLGVFDENFPSYLRRWCFHKKIEVWGPFHIFTKNYCYRSILKIKQAKLKLRRFVKKVYIFIVKKEILRRLQNWGELSFEVAWQSWLCSVWTCHIVILFVWIIT